MSISNRAAAVLAVALLLTACGSGGGGTAEPRKDSSGSSTPAAQLLPDDFVGVCSGATESQAADYATSRHHKALYFETYEDDLLDQSSRLPADWTVQFEAKSNALAAVDIVGCAVRTDQKLVKKCTGYDLDGTDAEGSVNLYTGTYELSAYEANTGKKLASTTIKAESEDCPTFASFDGDSHETDSYDSPSDQEVAGFLKKLVLA